MSRSNASDTYVPRRAVDGRVRGAHPAIDELRARNAELEIRGRHRRKPIIAGQRRWRLWLVPAAGVAALLLVVPFLGDGGDDSGELPAAVGSSPLVPEGSGTELETLHPLEPALGTLTPAPLRSRTPGQEASPTPSASPSPSKSSAPPQPVLLGPDGNSQLADMVERYCDRHVGSSSYAEARRDGNWQCERGILLSPRLVDMNVACSDKYGGNAYAKNSGGGAYGWRCYRPA